MANRYSKLPRRTHTHIVRLTEAEHNLATWLSRKLAKPPTKPNVSDVLRLALTPEMVALLLADKV